MRLFALFFTVLFTINSYGQLIHDESHLDPSFLKFKTDLMQCVIQKDTLKLKDFLADHVLESKDGCDYPGCTPDELIKYHFTYSADESWNSMLTILRFGFRRVEDQYPELRVPHDKTTFVGPSYVDKIDPSTELLILGENVRIRKQPSLNAEVIQTASYEVFKCDCSILTMTDNTFQTADGVDWIEVKIDNQTTGYVASTLTSYSLLRDMTIAKVDGQWKIISWFMGPGC